MSVLGQKYLTLADHAKRLDPSGKAAQIVEMLAQANPIIQDMPFIEGNMPTGHRTTVRTSLPSVYWRQLNQGVLSSKSGTAQIDEAIGLLEAWSEVDVELANLGGNPAEVRLQEAAAFIEAMGQEFASTLFYGEDGGEDFQGLSARYSATSAANGQNIVKAGGSDTDNSSIWLVCWGPMSLHGIFPKGSKAGIEHKNLGEATVENAGGVTGAKMRVYQDQFILKAGLVVRDWRYAVRIPNIDISALTSKSSAPDLIDKMIMAIHRVPSLASGKAAFYMNRTVVQMLDIQKRDDVISGGSLVYSEVDGKPVSSFRGIPIRTCDALLQNESLVS